MPKDLHLFYFPLFILAFSFSFDSVYAPVKKVVLLAFITALAINFVSVSNTYKTALWPFDSHTSEILSFLNAKAEKINKKIKLDFSWPFQSSIEFYKNKNLFPLVSVVKNKTDQEKLNLEAQYYIYFNKSLKKNGYNALTQKILNYKKDTILSFKKEGVYVFSNIR